MNLVVKSCLLFLSAGIILSSCSNESDEFESNDFKVKITQDNLLVLVNQIGENQDLDRESVDIITSGITRLSTLKRDTIIGKTIMEIYDIESAFQREQSNATLKTQGARVDLVLNHDFKFVGLIARDTLDKSLNLVGIEVTNTSKKEISNVQGTLQFYDANGQIVKTYPVLAKNSLNKETIPVGKTIRFIIPYTHDKNNIRDEMMRNDIKNMRAVWIATMLEFSDGSQISVQAANAIQK